MKLPHTHSFIRDVVIAGGFIAIGILAPGSPIEGGFDAHLGGIAVGLGLGWLHRASVVRSRGPHQPNLDREAIGVQRAASARGRAERGGGGVVALDDLEVAGQLRERCLASG